MAVATTLEERLRRRRVGDRRERSGRGRRTKAIGDGRKEDWKATALIGLDAQDVVGMCGWTFGTKSYARGMRGSVHVSAMHSEAWPANWPQGAFDGWRCSLVQWRDADGFFVCFSPERSGNMRNLGNGISPLQIQPRRNGLVLGRAKVSQVQRDLKRQS